MGGIAVFSAEGDSALQLSAKGSEGAGVLAEALILNKKSIEIRK